MSASSPRRPAVTFPEALSTREGWLEPFSWYREMRKEAPVRYDEDREVWDVFRYEDARRILADDGTFSSDPSNSPRFEAQFGDDERPPVLDTMLFADPPEHDRLRGVVDDFFRPGAVKAQSDRIERLTDEYLDRVAGEDRMDVVADLAYPMPVDVIAGMLGVPTDDRATFKSWSDALVERPKAGTEEELEAFQRRQQEVQREMSEYFSELIERRREKPRDDLITKIVTAEVDGQRLTGREMVGFCVLLLVAGNITTTNLISNAIRCFDEAPQSFAELAGDDPALSRAIEEVLRYRSPVQALFRVATRDAELSGETIPAGDGVVVWLGSANRDEAAFDDPDAFDPTRRPNQHLAFGHGTHYCLGAPLARLETKVALSKLADRFGDVERTDAELRPIRSSFIYGVEELPIRFDSG